MTASKRMGLNMALSSTVGSTERPTPTIVTSRSLAINSRPENLRKSRTPSATFQHLSHHLTSTRLSLDRNAEIALPLQWQNVDGRVKPGHDDVNRAILDRSYCTLSATNRSSP